MLARRMAPLRELRPPVADISPGMAGIGECERLFSRLENKKMVTEEYLVRHFLGIQQVLGQRGLDNAYWLHGVGKPSEWNGESRERFDPSSSSPGVRSMPPGYFATSERSSF